MISQCPSICLLSRTPQTRPVSNGFKQDARLAAHAGVPLAGSKQWCLQVCKWAGDLHLKGLAHGYQGGRRTTCHTIPDRHGTAACRHTYMDDEKLRLASAASISNPVLMLLKRLVLDSMRSLLLSGWIAVMLTHAATCDAESADL